MVPIGAFLAIVVQRHMALQHDLGLGRHLERLGAAIDEVEPPAGQKAGEAVFRERLGQRRDGGENGGGVGADHGGGGQRLALFRRPARMVAGAAAMLQPAHQRRVPPGDLHPVDAEVETVLGRPPRPPRHHQRPRDKRRGLVRPAGLDREAPEVDIVALQHDLLHRSAPDGARRHGQHGPEQRQHADRLAPAPRRLGLAEEGERLADLAEFLRLAPHAPGDTLHRAEQVCERWHAPGAAVRAAQVLEEQRRAARLQHAAVDFRHLQLRGYRRRYALEPARLFQPGHEVPQRAVGHGLAVLSGR